MDHARESYQVVTGRLPELGTRQRVKRVVRKQNYQYTGENPDINRSHVWWRNETEGRETED